MLNRGQQTGDTLALIDRTFSSDDTAANKTVTAGNGSGSGTNSGSTDNDTGSGINFRCRQRQCWQRHRFERNNPHRRKQQRNNDYRGKPRPFQPQQVDANFSWTGATNTIWNTSTNWSPSGPPGAVQTALFNGTFSNQPNVTLSRAVGTLHMATGVAQNVTLSSSAAQILTIMASVFSVPAF